MIITRRYNIITIAIIIPTTILYIIALGFNITRCKNDCDPKSIILFSLIAYHLLLNAFAIIACTKKNLIYPTRKYDIILGILIIPGILLFGGLFLSSMILPCTLEFTQIFDLLIPCTIPFVITGIILVYFLIIESCAIMSTINIQNYKKELEYNELGNIQN
jgi:hypothetical protein